jgi:hypothetical protein
VEVYFFMETELRKFGAEFGRSWVCKFIVVSFGRVHKTGVVFPSLKMRKAATKSVKLSLGDRK